MLACAAALAAPSAEASFPAAGQYTLQIPHTAATHGSRQVPDHGGTPGALSSDALPAFFLGLGAMAAGGCALAYRRRQAPDGGAT